MQSSPWSASRTILVAGISITLLIYALLGTSTDLSCRRQPSGAQVCSLTRYFLFKNDPVASIFDGSVLNWDNPTTGKNAYRITFVSRDGGGTMPALGGSGWQVFLQDQWTAFRQFPWRYIWQAVVYNRNPLVTAATFISLLWAVFLFSTLRGQNLK